MMQKFNSTSNAFCRADVIRQSAQKRKALVNIQRCFSRKNRKCFHLSFSMISVLVVLLGRVFFSWFLLMLFSARLSLLRVKNLLSYPATSDHYNDDDCYYYYYLSHDDQMREKNVYVRSIATFVLAFALGTDRTALRRTDNISSWEKHAKRRWNRTQPLETFT